MSCPKQREPSMKNACREFPAWPASATSIALLMIMTATLGATEARTLRPMRSGTELFVDDVKVARMEGVVRRTHAAEKPAGPVIEPAEPWEEGRIYIFGTAYRDPATGEFKLWYGSGSGKLLYATSRDGILWLKPKLGVAQYEGHETNIVLSGNPGASVLVDEAEPDASKRFKALMAQSRAQRHDGGFRGLYSADGIHWTDYVQYPLIPFGTEIGNLIRDPATGKYFAYVRPYWVTHHPKRTEEKRIGAVTTSDDMLHWSEMKVTLTPDAIDDAWVTESDQHTEFYAMNGWAYGQSYLGIVPLFRIKRLIAKPAPGQSGEDGPMEGQLISSRNGLDWQRLADRNPVVPSGPDFDKSVMNVATSPIIVGDEIWLYYTGINKTHGGTVPKSITICLAKWRLDGLVSLDAGAAGGRVETVPILNRTGILEVNADASKGAMTVAVLDEDGKPVPGYATGDCETVITDSVRHRIHWKTHPTLPSGTPFQLEFNLKRASLYSYTVVPLP